MPDIPPKPVGKQSTPSTAFESTLRMPRQEIDAIRQMLDGDGSAPPDVKRHFRRWMFDSCPVRIRMLHPGGMMTNLSYAARNISGGGMSILHSSYVHTGTKCQVTLPHRASGKIEVDATVIRCRHVTGKVHEIGLKFAKTVDIRDVLNFDPSETATILEHVEAQSLTGSLLLIEDSELDRVLIRKCLAETGLNVVPVENGTEAIERSGEGFDIILSELDLPDMTAPAFLRKLRERNIHTPMIVMSADPGARDRIKAEPVQPEGIIAKPFKPERLRGALAEFLLSEVSHNSGSMIYSSLAETDTAASLIPNFIDELKKLADQLAEAIDKKDAKACKKIAAHLRGSASMFGFDQIAKAATDAHAVLSRTDSVTDGITFLRALLGMCARVRVRKEAA